MNWFHQWGLVYPLMNRIIERVSGPSNELKGVQAFRAMACIASDIVMVWPISTTRISVDRYANIGTSN